MSRDGIEVVEMIVRRGRALRRRRAAEAAAVTGAVGCAAAAAVAGALGVQGEYRGAALAMAAAPLVMGAVLAAWRGLRRRLAITGWAAAVLIAGGVIGTGVLTVDSQRSGDWQKNLADRTDRGLLTVAMVAGAILAGAVPVLVRRVDLAGTAKLLDERGGFAERLATAAQVAGRAETDAAAEMVCRQGAEIGREGRADRVSLWSRTRATPAALAVAAMLWATVLLLPVLRAGGLEEPADLAAMTNEQKDELVRKIQAAAGEAGSAAVDAQLAELPAAVQAGDREAVAKMLEALRKAGVDVRRAVGGQYAAMIEEGKGAAGARGSGQERPVHPAGRDSSARFAPREVGGGGPVAWVGPGAPGEQKGPVEGGAGEMMPYDVAWRQATERAAGALDSGAVPARYVQLVRDFFAAQGR